MDKRSGLIEHETDLAWLFYDAETEEMIWLPKSCCRWDEDYGEMTIPRWLMRETGFF